MPDLAAQDQVVVGFTAPQAGTAPLTWGQKAILQDMQASGGQFSMGGRARLPEGSTVEGVTAMLGSLMGRHAALRMRLGTDAAGRPYQAVDGSGQISLEIMTLPDDAEVVPSAVELMDTWPRTRFDFGHDWPLRMAVLRQRGACRYLVWVLSHLVADGGAHLLFLDDLISVREAGTAAGEFRGPDILDIARGERAPQTRQLSSRAMRYWESALRDIPAQTFGEPGRQPNPPDPDFWQARFTSPAAHLAMLAIARRTGTDASRVTLAMIATAIGRATGAAPLTIKLMVNNRFRPGLAGVIAPIAQNSVVTIDVTDTSVDQVVARSRSATLTAGMRAYYDPDELAELTARLDAERGYPARVTCRVNDQRAMIMRADGQNSAADVTPEQIGEKLAETSLTWLGPREHMHEQVNILIENRTDAVSLHMMWDRACLTDAQVEALLRGVEEVAVEAAFDPSAPTKVSAR
jgi:hypothetical protein